MSGAQENPDIPSGEVKDNSYTTQSVMDGSVPVVKDDNVKDPIDPNTANSDETLEADEKEAIKKDNIMNERTRGAAKQNYSEPGDEEGLPTDTGKSAIAS